jgi:hypothetical protein
VGVFRRFSTLRSRLESAGVDLFKDINAVVDINVGGRHMSDRKLTKDELERQRGEGLPDREVMTTLNPPIQPMPPVGGTDDIKFPIDPTHPPHPESTGGTS